MTSPSVLRVLLCAAVMACARSAPRTAPRSGADDGLASVIRVLVADSAGAGTGGGRYPVSPADTFSARLLGQTGHPVIPPVRGEVLVCPGSTLANGAPHPGPRGYYLHLEIVPDARDSVDSTVRVVHVTHSCMFIYQGEARRGGVFATTAFWEVHRREGRWRIVRLLARAIT